MNTIEKNESFYTLMKERAHQEENRLNALLDPQPLACDFEAGTTAIAFRIQPWQRNPYGDAHGGAIASMFDTAMGFTAFWISDGSWTTTVDLMINYLSPMPAGEEMVVYSQAKKAGRSLIRVTAEAKVRSSDKLVATASANFMLLR